MNSSGKPAEKKPIKKAIFVLSLLLLCSVIGVGALITVYNMQLRTTGSASSGIRQSSSITLDDNGSAVKGMARSKSSSEVLADLKKSEVYVTDKLSSNVIFPSGQSGTA